MNYTRLVLAAVVATVVDGLYGYLVYGMVLGSEFGRYPAIYRSTDSQTAYLPVMFLGLLVGMLAVTYIYAKGYEGGSGVMEGLRFGIGLAVFLIGYVVAVDYAIMNIGRRLTAYMAIAGLVEWIIVGSLIGAVYKPAGAAATGRRGPAA